MSEQPTVGQHLVNLAHALKDILVAVSRFWWHDRHNRRKRRRARREHRDTPGFDA